MKILWMFFCAILLCSPINTLAETNGTVYSGWKYDNSKWFYYGSDGVMRQGWVNDQGKWYFLDSSGAMKTGWLLYKERWYFLDRSGVMQTGWLLQNNQWHYLNHSGAMQTGWIYLNKWYYFNQKGSWIPNTLTDQFTTISDNNQLILVTTNGYNTNKAKIQTFEKIDKVRNGRFYRLINKNLCISRV
ncbi:hypothetical protein ABES02_15980 [Neobacillus pocheonensis]|uniref:hypothetical protein n=1 Tax=Neobacillus pocheonensis TaxID=363869 RepID=UPI003D2C4168